jgi:hypothetical protein
MFMTRSGSNPNWHACLQVRSPTSYKPANTDVMAEGGGKAGTPCRSGAAWAGLHVGLCCRGVRTSGCNGYIMSVMGSCGSLAGTIRKPTSALRACKEDADRCQGSTADRSTARHNGAQQSILAQLNTYIASTNAFQYRLRSKPRQDVPRACCSN